MDVVASAGIEVFILDGPQWVSAYGNWLVPRSHFKTLRKTIMKQAI